MAKIPSYPALTAPNNADLLIIEDSVSSSTKKITRSNFLKGTALPADTVDAQAILIGSVTPEKLISGAGTSWPYASFTPTLANFTIGNGTIVGRYKQTGKRVEFFISIVFGSTTSFTSSPTFTLPVTAASYQTTTPIMHLGRAQYLDASASKTYDGIATLSTTTTSLMSAIVSDQTYGFPTPLNAGGAPFSGWTTGDTIVITGSYEAA